MGGGAKSQEHSEKQKMNDVLSHEFSSGFCFYFLLLTALCSLSSDHFVRPRQHVRRDREANLFRRLEIDDELELHRLFHWQVGRLAPFENLVHVGGSAPVNVSEIDPISHE